MPITRLALRCMIAPLADQVISKAVGVSKGQLSSCTVNRKTLDPVTLMDLAFLLDCEIDQLVGWADNGVDSSDLTAECPCLEAGLDNPRIIGRAGWTGYFFQWEQRPAPDGYQP